MRGSFLVCLSLSLIAKVGAAAEVVDTQTALRLACNAESEIHDGGKRQSAQRECESNYEARDGGNDIWIVEPKQHSFGYTSYSVRKSNGDVIISIIN